MLIGIFPGWNVYDTKIEGYFPKDKIHIEYGILDDNYNKRILDIPTKNVDLIISTEFDNTRNIVEIDLSNFTLTKLETEHETNIIIKKYYFLRNDENVAIDIKTYLHVINSSFTELYVNIIDQTTLVNI